MRAVASLAHVGFCSGQKFFIDKSTCEAKRPRQDASPGTSGLPIRIDLLPVRVWKAYMDMPWKAKLTERALTAYMSESLGPGNLELINFMADRSGRSLREILANPPEPGSDWPSFLVEERR
jgi:hypothetical protein